MNVIIFAPRITPLSCDGVPTLVDQPIAHLIPGAPPRVVGRGAAWAAS
jgi:hypothetical protein